MTVTDGNRVVWMAVGGCGEEVVKLLGNGRLLSGGWVREAWRSQVVCSPRVNLLDLCCTVQGRQQLPLTDATAKTGVKWRQVAERLESGPQWGPWASVSLALACQRYLEPLMPLCLAAVVEEVAGCVYPDVPASMVLDEDSHGGCGLGVGAAGL
ncbi:hypothetical protein Pyn_31460 [Prunus yedoensis var. nudiflora]|uniref:Uncharacterized protein n=1 Tax=Prunus yedoensis var. nudiflora TaxID=2094558 RepID=A0A314ZPP2_PRUYE|nr:hypothetical protein Pyn_31460 [Prunus yedoensis var. nudiflora]